MRVILKINLGPLWDIVARLKDPETMKQIGGIMGGKGVAAIMSRAIADNFDVEGPGWKALKARTIKGSVNKALKAKLAKLSDKEVLERERLARDWKDLSPKAHGRLTELNKKAGIKSSAKQSIEPARRILQGTGLLRNSVTTVGAAHNIYKPEQNKLTWGTDLKYAAIHNRGGVVAHPGTKDGFGRGVKIPAHNIPIPKRRFLYLQDRWMDELRAFVVDRARRIVMERLKGA